MFLPELLNFLFDRYEKSKIRYCLLRNYEQLPDDLDSGDVDILIARQDRSANKIVIEELVQRFGLTVYNHYEDERILQYFLYKRISETELFFLKLDFFFQSELYGCRYISGEQFINGRRRYKYFYVADDIDGLLDKVVYLYLLNAEIPRRYLAKAKKILDGRGEELQDRLIAILGARHGRYLFKTLAQDDYISGKVTVFNRLLILGRLALEAPFAHFLKAPCYIYYRLKYRLLHQGEMISLSGPDGCGKTTLLAFISQHLSEAFRFGPENIFHHRPHLLPRIAEIAKKANVIDKVDEDYCNPHRGKPSGMAGSLLRLGYYLTDYFVGYFVKVRPVLVRREPVIFDRYYHDTAADPERLNISLPFSLLSLFLHFVPKPNSSFFIFVNSKAIPKRKNELVKDRIETLNARYAKLAEQHKDFIQIPNEHDPNITAAAIVDSIIQRRAKRLTSWNKDK